MCNLSRVVEGTLAFSFLQLCNFYEVKIHPRRGYRVVKQVTTINGTTSERLHDKITRQ
jgi:hypothetical protein